MFCHFAKCQKISSNFLLFLLRGSRQHSSNAFSEISPFPYQEDKGCPRSHLHSSRRAAFSSSLPSSSHFSQLLPSPPQNAQRLFSGINNQGPPSKAKAALIGLFLETPLRKKAPPSPLQAQKREVPPLTRESGRLTSSAPGLQGHLRLPLLTLMLKPSHQVHGSAQGRSPVSPLLFYLSLPILGQPSPAELS